MNLFIIIPTLLVVLALLTFFFYPKGNKHYNHPAIVWIDALLNTKLKQGKRKLGNKSIGFCCLGLACHVNNINFFADNIFLSKEQKEKIGLISKYGESISKDSPKSLIFLNDNNNFSFPQIAKILIKHPESYFVPEVAKLIRNHYN